MAPKGKPKPSWLNKNASQSMQSTNSDGENAKKAEAAVEQSPMQEPHTSQGGPVVANKPKIKPKTLWLDTRVNQGKQNVCIGGESAEKTGTPTQAKANTPESKSSFLQQRQSLRKVEAAEEKKQA